MLTRAVRVRHCNPAGNQLCACANLPKCIGCTLKHLLTHFHPLDRPLHCQRDSNRLYWCIICANDSIWCDTLKSFTRGSRACFQAGSLQIKSVPAYTPHHVSISPAPHSQSQICTPSCAPSCNYHQWCFPAHTQQPPWSILTCAHRCSAVESDRMYLAWL